MKNIETKDQVAPSFGRALKREFSKDRVAKISLILLIIILLGVFIGGTFFVKRPDYMIVNLLERYKLPFTDGHIFGTDGSGHDVFKMLLIGGRNSLFIAFAVTLITNFIGISIGIICGYYGGRIDNIIMRIVDFLTILPQLMIIIVLTTIVPNYNAMTLVLIISAFGWIGTVRPIRARVLTEANRDYVRASKTSGSSNFAIMFREILPNIISLIIAGLTLDLAGNIGLETGLTFLGFGLPVGTPSLGTMLNQATNPETMTGKPWVWIPSAIFILIIVILIIFVAQAVRRAGDQRQSQ
ncbi:ABC transporter permease [Floricoccus penangensis]|uniref:ABC transporter permease n=1 Tax=Floricoccus penangensis TaxID=1859475 RepID=UPI003B839C88